MNKNKTNMVSLREREESSGRDGQQIRTLPGKITKAQDGCCGEDRVLCLVVRYCGGWGAF